MSYYYNPCHLPTFYPPQQQAYQPGIEALMVPRPVSEPPPGCVQSIKKLLNKTAIITGGDSGIGRATALAFAKEGADIAMIYLNEHIDALETKARIEQLGRKCLAIAIDVSIESNCQWIVQEVIREFNRLDILVNNAAVIYPQNTIEEISASQLDWTFRVNVYSYFFLIKAALRFMKPGSSIINTSSIAVERPFGIAIDYEASKGAVTALTKALSRNLIPRGIRVNSVAPGHVWTPLIPASFSAHEVVNWGTDAPMGRAAQPYEIAPAYVYLASDDSSYVTGQTINVFA